MPRILTQADVADFRNRLCDTASELFAEVGQAGFNMRELAKRLGVSAMTPYRYFEDKDSILSEVRARAFARFADWLEEQRSGDGDALTRAYAQFAIEQQIQYRLMFDLGQPQDALPPTLLKQERRARAAMAGHARDLVKRNQLAGDPEQLGLILWSTLHGVATLYLTGKLSSREFDQVLSQAIPMFAGKTGPSSGQAPDAHRPEARFSPDLVPQNRSALMAG